MEIPKLPNSSINVNKAPLIPTDLFKQISQLGSIEARVALISQGQALLNSQLGQILSANTLDLKTGDRLQLRASGTEQAPVLKVNKLIPEPAKLITANTPRLEQALSTDKPVVALIIGNKADSTLLQIGHQRIEIRAQSGLKSGQLVTLQKTADGTNVDIRPVNHQQVLKSAIKQLLPNQQSNQQPAAVLQLARLIHSISLTKSPVNNIASEPTTGISKELNINASTGLQNPVVSQVAQQSSSASQNPTSAQDSNFFSRLEALVKSLPQLAKLDKAGIQQWVRYIAASSQSSNTSTPNLFQLLQQLPASETSVTQQFKQWAGLSSPATTAQSAETNTKTSSQDLLQQVGREIIKLTEQTINHQLLQQTNLRFQQELQQPIAFNLSIPIEDRKNIQELQLKIRQNRKDTDTDKQSWDIHLDFEFGSLGQISTHLLLEENTLSVSFWSSKLETQQKIDSNLDDFKSQLGRAGFSLGQFHSFAGQKPEIDNRGEPGMPEALLDIRV